MSKVVGRGTKDGYSTATVEFLKDNLPEDPNLKALQVGSTSSHWNLRLGKISVLKSYKGATSGIGAF